MPVASSAAVRYSVRSRRGQADTGDVNVKVKATLLLLVWLAAYMVIGGAVWAVASSLLLSTALGDMMGILIAGALTIVLGWLGASWVQRRVDIAISEKTPAAGTSPKHE